MSEPPISMTLERAIRRAADWHDGQHRKGSTLPYMVHPFAVAMILDRLGFAEDVVIAGLLHDVVEDTEATLADVETEFGPRVAELVGWCSERKKDDSGAHRPWADRKRDHIEALAAAPTDARAVVLADKLHNLTSIRFDLDDVAYHKMLGEISEEEDAQGRGLLSAIVVHKTGDQEPGTGFYELAEALGRNVSDRLRCWTDEVKLAYQVWANLKTNVNVTP